MLCVCMKKKKRNRKKRSKTQEERRRGRERERKNVQFCLYVREKHENLKLNFYRLNDDDEKPKLGSSIFSRRGDLSLTSVIKGI